MTDAPAVADADDATAATDAGAVDAALLPDAGDVAAATDVGATGDAGDANATADAGDAGATADASPDAGVAVDALDAVVSTDAVDAAPDAGGGCRTDGDCVGRGRCDRARGACVECFSGADCRTEAPLCVANRCAAAVPCASTRTCAGLVCDTSAGRCVECVSDVDCPSGRACRGSSCAPLPVACLSGRECSPFEQVCDAARRRCVDCVADADCAPGQVCAPGNVCLARVCAPAARECVDAGRERVCDASGSAWAEAPCGPGRVCAAGACRAQVCAPGAESCGAGAVRQVCAPDGLGYASTPCPAPTGALAACAAGRCGYTCAAGSGDCDGAAANGCETSFATDPAHCGRCGATCVVAHATPSCSVGGVCGVARCDAGWGDCDGAASNGCETDLSVSVSHCGVCRNACAFPGSGAACAAGGCVPTACAAGRGDCDGVASNGCEVDTRATLAHCGACGRACAPRPGGASSCVDSSCRLTCASGYGDCDGSDVNGCETDTRASAAHCGACGRACAPANAVGTCASSTCTITRCNAGFGDCYGAASDGCETDLSRDGANCGACGRACAPANAAGACVAGACTVTRCTGSFGDCDRAASNGCETDLAGDGANCGACGARCPTGTTCTLGRCAEATFAGYSVGAPPSSVTWIDACAAPGRAVALVGADDEVVAGALPFTVWFWGASNDAYLLSANGVVGFGPLFYNLAAVPDRGSLRSWGPPLTRIFPAAYLFGIDLVTGPSGVCVAAVGAAPGRTWVAQFTAAQHYLSSVGSLAPTSFTFELLAHEGDRNFDVLYGAPFVAASGLPMTSPDPILVGLQDFRSTTSPRTAVYSGAITATTRLRFSPM